MNPWAWQVRVRMICLEAASAADAFACSRATVWEVPDFPDRRRLEEGSVLGYDEAILRRWIHI